MKLKNRLELMFRGWFPKEPKMADVRLRMAEAEAAKPKPWWWKPVWLISFVLTVVFGAVGCLLLDPVVLEVFGVMAVTLIFVGFSYYINARSAVKANRAMYIMLGLTVIGFFLWLIWAMSGIGKWVTHAVGSDPSLLISLVVCYGTGALIGDLIGKKRNYVLPVAP